MLVVNVKASVSLLVGVPTTDGAAAALLGKERVVLLRRCPGAPP
jgi:hypothetical protein